VVFPVRVFPKKSRAGNLHCPLGNAENGPCNSLMPVPKTTEFMMWDASPDPSLRQGARKEVDPYRALDADRTCSPRRSIASARQRKHRYALKFSRIDPVHRIRPQGHGEGFGRMKLHRRSPCAPERDAPGWVGRNPGPG